MPDKIYLASRVREALDGPNFVVKKREGLYFLAVAVVEYDESKMTDAQKRSFRRLKANFEQALSADPEACGSMSFSQSDDGDVLGVQTDPPTG